LQYVFPTLTSIRHDVEYACPEKCYAHV
jgi:hypothetical protein